MWNRHAILPSTYNLYAFTREYTEDTAQGKREREKKQKWQIGKLL